MLTRPARDGENIGPSLQDLRYFILSVRPSDLVNKMYNTLINFSQFLDNLVFKENFSFYNRLKDKINPHGMNRIIV